MRKDIVMKCIMFFMMAAVCTISSYATSTVIDSENVNVQFEFNQASSAYLIGFSDSSVKPEEHVIDETFLKVNPDDGYAYDNDKVFVFWKITSVVPFEISLSSAGDDITVSWENMADDIILTTSSTYSKSDYRKLEIKTVKDITELPIAKHSWGLTLGIRAL